MTPDERQMITGLFDRMRSFGAPEKDREAEAIISEAVRSMPDARLHAGAVRAGAGARAAGGRQPHQGPRGAGAHLQGAGQPRRRGSGSFLGGLFGGGRPVSQPGASSVPVDRFARRGAAGLRPGSAAAVGASRAAATVGPAGLGRLPALGHGDGCGRRRRHAGGGRYPRPHGRQCECQYRRQHAGRQSQFRHRHGQHQTSAEQAQQDREQDARQDASDDDSSWGDSGGDLDI